MSDFIVPQTSASPFDSIRRVVDGREYWSARELMPLLGYQTWQKFMAVVESAQENVEASGEQLSDHFLTVELKTLGRPATDFHLSRFAAYHVALSCDSRGNASVKAAKTYFVVKTREAEVGSQPPAYHHQLPSRVLAVETARAVVEIQESLQYDNPRLSQLLIDVAINDALVLIGATPASLNAARLRGVAEIAQKLGYKVTPENRSQLGKHVRKTCEEFGVQEERLCNGVMTKVWCYPEDNQLVLDAIESFFEG